MYEATNDSALKIQKKKIKRRKYFFLKILKKKIIKYLNRMKSLKYIVKYLRKIIKKNLIKIKIKN